LDWSSDGAKVATGGKDRQVKLWVHWVILISKFLYKDYEDI
jgi:WD40 repeat protein